MIVDGSFQYGMALVKEGAVFLKGGDSRRMWSSEGDPDGGGYSAFFFIEVGQLLNQDQAPRYQLIPHICYSGYP